MIDCILRGPVDTRWEGVKLRLLAYRPSHYPNNGTVKCVVQVVDGLDVIAEDALAEEWMPLPRFREFIRTSIEEGWRK